MRRTLLTNALITTGASSNKGSLAIEDGRIAGIWLEGTEEAGQSEPDLRAGREFPDADVIDLGGKVLMAGGIDAHVHFREPGLTHKADIESESRAALLGGITSFIDMPNTKPATTTSEALEEKLALAEGRSWANYGFHIGATNGNCHQIKEMLHNGMGCRFGGIKVFMGSSTGNMLVDESDSLKELFQMEGKTILVHCEDEATIKANLERATASGDIPFRCHPEIRSRLACIRSTAKALELAIKHGTSLHLLHISTAEEVEMVRAAKIHNPAITAETCPNYLWFSDNEYASLGGRLKCNPSIKSAADRAALRKALAEGVIDTIGSDHAPHLAEEKDHPYLCCPSGLPSIQFGLPVTMSVAKGWDAEGPDPDAEEVPLPRLAAAYSEKIASILGIKGRGSLEVGNVADLLVLDPDGVTDVGPETIVSKCGWSPYEGQRMCGSVSQVYLAGELVVDEGRLLGTPKGKPLEFCASV